MKCLVSILKSAMKMITFYRIFVKQRALTFGLSDNNISVPNQLNVSQNQTLSLQISKLITLKIDDSLNIYTSIPRS